MEYAAAILVCLIGDGTAWRDWVEWEIKTAAQFHKGICGVRLKGSFGRTPDALTRRDAPIAKWDMPDIIATIECAEILIRCCQRSCVETGNKGVLASI